MTAVFNRLGPYEILDEIGRGGMAQVFLAKDTRSDQTVALKVVPSGKDREAREILEAEQSGAELQRQFSKVSSHVPLVYEHRQDESGYFLVSMEYLDGENLSDLIARGAIPAERAVQIAIELCACLAMAHHFAPGEGDRPLRLVHGDLKPRNVRITSTGAVKVLDFGIAKALSLSRKVTRNDFGTMPYLSPERLETAEVDEYADLWAVGVMLYEMIRGRQPYQAADTQRLERLIRARVPPLPLTGICPIGLEAIVARLLGPSPGVRYDSARAVREDLERFASGARTAAEDQGWPARLIDEAPTQRTRPAADQDDEKTRRTRPPAPVAGHVPPERPAPARTAGAPPGPATRPRRRPAWFRFALGSLVVILLAMMANELSVAGDARRVAADVATRELEELGDAWRAHRDLSNRSNLRFGTLALERVLTQRTMALAEKVIANYRMAVPTVREAQWRSARDAVAQAMRIAPYDRRLRATYRYCDAHLHRINGEARKRRNEDVDAQRELLEAVASFREAADLRPEWPDPFLGLARTFIYGLEDVDRGADALSQAESRGYPPTEREMTQLADGYRARGDSLVRNARQLSGMPQESDYLTRAVEAYQRALTLYSRASSLTDGPPNIRFTQRVLDQTQRRLDELQPLPSEPALLDPADAATPEPHTDSDEQPGDVAL